MEIKNLIRTEVFKRLNGGPRRVHVLKCSEPSCDSEIRVRATPSEFNKSSLLCKSHSQRIRPFESIYNTFRNDHRELDNDITYEQFVELTKITECHYCLSKIIRIEYPIVKGSYTSNAYYLDRIDNEKGHILSNVVVCCSRCNGARSNKFSYEEWLGMTEYFRKRNTYDI